MQRDLYLYLHDQTLRMLNQGDTGAEIAERTEMPPVLEQQWHTHGYTGTVDLAAAIAGGTVVVDGDPTVLGGLVDLVAPVDPTFNIVTP